jgi:GNAT superfamily N-acetyltransferase
MAVVRQLTQDDWSILREVRLAALADAPDAFVMTYADAVGLDEDEWRIRTTRSDMFVAFVGGEAVGLVGLFGPDSRDGDRTLIAMWVAPPLRGTGVADALVAAAVARAAGLGASGVKLEVAPGNNRAEKLYARHSFAATDDAPEIVGGTVMRLPLPAGEGSAAANVLINVRKI